MAQSSDRMPNPCATNSKKIWSCSITAILRGAERNALQDHVPSCSRLLRLS